jgi:hypothetical protein
MTERAKEAGFTADGREEAARAGGLQERQAQAIEEVRARHEPRIASAPWLKKPWLWLRMWSEMRREEARIEAEVAPFEGLYLTEPAPLSTRSQ